MMESYGIQPVYDVQGNNSNDGFGSNGGWIWIIFLFFIMAWGGNAWGGYGAAGANMAQGYVTQADLQRGFDTQSVLNKLNGLENGLCDGFYAQNTNSLTGFDRITNNTNQGFAGLNTAIVTNGYDTRNALLTQTNNLSQGINNLGFQIQNGNCQVERAIEANTVSGLQSANSLQAQISKCCCDNEKAIMGVNFNAQTNTANIQRQVCESTRDVIDNANANTRAILDFMTNSRLQDLQAENSDLRLRASQADQNNTLISALRPTPIPAYITCSPYTSYGIYQNGCNCGTATNSCCGY